MTLSHDSFRALGALLLNNTNLGQDHLFLPFLQGKLVLIDHGLGKKLLIGKISWKNKSAETRPLANDISKFSIAMPK